ncbi:MAG: hypothetical protein ACI82H_000288, partial [Alphaproteobacteria bacterium]
MDITYSVKANMVSSRAMAVRASGGSDAASIVLKGRYEIAYEPLPEKFGAPGTLPYGVHDLLNPDRALFALVCNPELPPRANALEKLQDCPSRALLRLLDYGAVPWPETSDHRFILIYEWPEGTKLVPSMDREFEPMPEADIINRVIAPVTGLLDNFATMGMTHGTINPTNMFTTVDDTSQIIVGENASAPPWYHQSAAFLPINLAQAMPAGRGAGTIADDIYALGVSVLMLILGKDPAVGRTDAELLEAKIERGSFITLAGHTRVPAVLREPLRGMLEDRPEMRWQISDLHAWLIERRLKSSHHAQVERAQRAFTLNGKSFHHPRTLAQELAISWESVQFKDKGHEILTWARRGICDDTVGDAVLNAMENSERTSGGNGSVNPAFIARLAMALDRKAPVRYRHIAAHPDGFGVLLATKFIETDSVRDITEAILEDLPGFCLRTHRDDDSGISNNKVASKFGRLMRVIKNTHIGFGIERCLYEMNPYQYCRSPLVVKQKVMQIGDLLPALERVSSESHKGPPFDRHIAAFIAAHLKVELQSMLALASDPRDSERAALGMLGVLATLQAQVDRKPYPGVARWLAKYLRPTVESFRHKMWREKVESELPNLIGRGDITSLYIYLANGEIRQHDRNGYAEAIAEYARLAAEKSFLNSFGLNDPNRVQEYGHQLAAGLAGLVSLVAMAFSF